MKKTPIVNANSFGRYFPEFLDDLSKNVGEVERFKFPADIDQKQLAKELSGFSFIVIGTEPQLTKDFFQEADSLKLVARFGIGYNNVDVIAANENGVMVSNIPAFMEKDDVAEHAAALTLSMAKLLVFSSTAVKNGEWAVNRERYLGQRVNGKTVGICGFGNIGVRYGEIMKSAFNCEIICYDPYLSEEEVKNRGGKKVTFEQLLADSDIISLHMNVSAENKGIFNEKSFSQMKNSAVLINSARGGLVIEDDIIKALDAGQIGGYATDVLEFEPPKADHPFLHHEKIIATPHIGAYNRECNHMMCSSVVSDIKNVLAGKEPTNRLYK